MTNKSNLNAYQHICDYIRECNAEKIDFDEIYPQILEYNQNCIKRSFKENLINANRVLKLLLDGCTKREILTDWSIPKPKINSAIIELKKRYKVKHLRQLVNIAGNERLIVEKGQQRVASSYSVSGDIKSPFILLEENEKKTN